MVFRRSSSKSILKSGSSFSANKDSGLQSVFCSCSLYPQQHFFSDDDDTVASAGTRSRANSEESVTDDHVSSSIHPNQGPIIKLTSAQPKSVSRAVATRVGSPRSSTTWRKQYTPTEDAPESPFYSSLARGEDPTLLKLDIPTLNDINNKASELLLS